MALRTRYAGQYGALLALLEDEALNSDKSATLIGSYCKGRLELGERLEGDTAEAGLTVVFEHDVISDGE